MNIKSHLFKGLLGLSALWLAAPLASGMGQVMVHNCYDKHLFVGAADWDDITGGMILYHKGKWLKPGETHTFVCDKRWLDSDAAGCKMVLNSADSNYDSMGMGRRTSGSYYAYYSERKGCYVLKAGLKCPSKEELDRMVRDCT